MKRLETFDLTREFLPNPSAIELSYTRLNVSVRLYENSFEKTFTVIRSHYIAEGTHTPNLCSISDTVEDGNEAYDNLEEAFNAFSVQCVKAFTQQVTWLNSKKTSQERNLVR